MKCVRQLNQSWIVERVGDEDAASLVEKGEAIYVPKHWWKKQRQKESE